MSAHPRQLYGIVGQPVGHSLSPALHNWGFARHGLLCVYMAWEKSALDLPGFISAVRGLPVSGVSVTIPNKEAVMPLVDRLTPTAKAVGAVNTLYWEDGALIGGNTDMDGFLFPLEGNAPPAALVLGAGGASRAVLAGLAQLGTAKVTLAARSLPRAELLQRDFGCRVIPWEDRAKALRDMGQGLVVNATPLGMRGEFQNQSPLPRDAWPLPEEAGGRYIAYDIIYTPRETVFLKDARARGWTGLDGLAFFTAQGLSQFRIWTGLGLPFAEALAVVEAALEERRASEGA